MQHATQVDLTRQILRDLEARTTSLADAVTTNPVSAYTDPARMQREVEVLFRRYPLLMGASCQLREPGDYVTDDFSGVPILATRSEVGDVRAFLNVCRHRGAKLARGCGHVKRNFVCPYHGWSYSAEGKLVGIPDKASFDGLDADAHGLVELPVAEKHGLVWALPTPGMELDIDAHLAGLGPELGAYRFEGYHYYNSRVIRRQMNWKVAVDTFLEPYHFGVLHTDTVAPILFPNICHFESFGANLREVFPRRTIVDLREQATEDWDLVTHSAIVYILFPNTALVMQADHIELWRIYPANGKVDECVMYLDFYIPEPAETPSAHEHWRRNLDLVLRTVEEEDFPVGEEMQFGFASGAQEHVIYGRNEPALAHFERSVTEALDAAAA